MSRHLFGVETELAVAAERGDGTPLPVEEPLLWCFDMGRRTLRHLPDERGGMFLENGARFYRDSGGSADHLEFATPETVNPWDTVRYILAGEQMMLGLADRVREARPELGSVRVMKHNANYGQQRGAAWGTHESYLHRCSGERLQRDLIPFLVTRILYTGAGGFDPLSPGLKFMLSPRVVYLGREVSGDTTHERGIYNTKNESLCGDSEQWRRLHLVCGESNCSETSMWLKIATTAMVVALIGAGISAGESVALLRPVEAMKRFAADPHLRRAAKRAGGSLVTPLQVQRHYLTLAEAHQNDDFMPEWAPWACALWREVLDQLESGGAAAVATRLDWAIKYALFTRHLESRGFTWEDAERLTKLAGRLQRALERREFGASGLQVLYLEPRHLQEPSLEVEATVPVRDRARLCDFLSVRDQLFELDLRFMTVGPQGLFRQLDQAGVLRHHVAGVDNIPHAQETPPVGSRALVRGQTVKDLGDAKNRASILCMWNMIHAEDKVLDLRDPFQSSSNWAPCSPRDLELIAGYPPGIFHHFRSRL